MAPKVKGLFKGFKYITHIFVYKDPGMEIGYPTDVRHVAHIGFDADSVYAPSWISQYKSPPLDVPSASLNDFMVASLNVFVPSLETSSSSQDFKQPRRWQSVSSCADSLCSEITKRSKKKNKPTEVNVPSPAMSGSSSRASFSTAFEEPLGVPPSRLPTAYEKFAPEMPNQIPVVIHKQMCA